ncbi:2-phosphosulfolactate phosphatase [Thermodesulfobacteriota bacterium]
MKIKVLHLIEGARQATGLTVIIDVFRAFTVACYAVANGARQIIPVGDMELAHHLKKQDPDRILMGERDGKIQPGFDFGNSPSQISELDFTGKSIVQTTSSGTQGFANAANAEELISGSLVNADAIVAYIQSKVPETVSLVCMGTYGVDPNVEDELCGKYIRARLLDEPFNVDQMIEIIKNSDTAKKFHDPSKPWYPEADIECCIDINRFNFVLAAESYGDGLIALKPVTA